MLFPADDVRFRDAVLLAVELFRPGDGQPRPPMPPRAVDDERLLAAAQAMLRAAYPLATILVDPDDAMPAPATWRVYRDPQTLDDGLLDAARSGDATAAIRLGGRYRAIALLFAWPICGGPAAATAAVTEAMAQLLRPDRNVDAGHVAGTLLRLARRAAVARRSSTAGGENAGESAGEDDGRARLASALGRLSPSQAEGLSLAYGEGMSEAEVAMALGLDETRTRALIRGALAELVDARPGGASRSS
jgi:DNA-directed RNA polymerase specialized sigma24 family protein